jgi:hypothetical protein
MRLLSKSLILLLIISFAISGLSLSIKPTTAQSIPKPSVPEFTVTLADHSYDVPPTTTTTTDPYTGKQITTTQSGYHVENKTVEATIKNPSGATYYNFRWKGHYENQWRYEPFNPNKESNAYTLEYSKSVPFKASTSTYTLLTLYFIKANSITPGGEIDIQVQALYGDFDAVPSQSQPMHGGLIYDFYFNGTASDWSNTQTITVLSTNPTPTPTVPEFSWLEVIPLMVAMLSVAVLLRHRKTS